MGADTVVVVVVLLRFTIPLFIPKYPLPAILAALVLDAADQTIFSWVTSDPLPGYQSYDKALDVYYLAIAYIATMRTWRDPVAFQLSRFLYLYRLIGVTLFELTHARWLLLVFPNTFEYFFDAYEAVRTRWNPLRMSATALVGTAAFIWIVIKLPQEWWIHVAQLDFTEFMDDNPWAYFVIGAAALALAIGLWVNRRKIPKTDWPFTVAVDKHLPPIEVTVPRTTVFDEVLVEKVVFMSLVAVIFAQIVPDVRSEQPRHRDRRRRARRAQHRRQRMDLPPRALVAEHLHRLRRDVGDQRRHRVRRLTDLAEARLPRTAARCSWRSCCRC